MRMSVGYRDPVAGRREAAMVTAFLQRLLHSPMLTFANQNLKLSNGANGQRTMQLPLSRSFDRAVIMMMIADMIAAAQRPPARRSEAALRLDQLWRFVSLSGVGGSEPTPGLHTLQCGRISVM